MASTIKGGSTKGPYIEDIDVENNPRTAKRVTRKIFEGIASNLLKPYAGLPLGFDPRTCAEVAASRSMKNKKPQKKRRAIEHSAPRQG